MPGESEAAVLASRQVFINLRKAMVLGEVVAVACEGGLSPAG